MKEPVITKQQARQFLLWKHGLAGEYRFEGSKGILAFVRQVGCIQYDPIDVCGKNAELVLLSRVKGFTKPMLTALLYQERLLFDYFDKNLSIFPIEDYPYFQRERDAHRQRERSHEEITAVRQSILQTIKSRGPVCSADLNMSEKVDWYWSSTKLSRAALEHLYFTGDLAVHHKKGTQKYYDLAENCVPASILQTPDPFTMDAAHYKWRIQRRIGAVGLMWNRASDAWLNIPGLKTAQRLAAFSQLLEEDKLTGWQVEGIPHTLYSLKEDLPLMEWILTSPQIKRRCEFIAPLDNLLWDRKLIHALFDFEYKWEIYTPEKERKFGYYVLPVLYGDQFAARIEVNCDRKNGLLRTKNLWLSEGVRPTKVLNAEIARCLKKLARFHQLQLEK